MRWQTCAGRAIPHAHAAVGPRAWRRPGHGDTNSSFFHSGMRGGFFHLEAAGGWVAFPIEDVLVDGEQGVLIQTEERLRQIYTFRYSSSNALVVTGCGESWVRWRSRLRHEMRKSRRK